MNRLRAALARLPANEEHGGILLGRAIDAETTEVTSCEFFPSAHRKGTLYDLGARERQRVALRARELESGKRERPVGYFRTHQRPGLFLDQDDFALMEEAFRAPGSVALLMRPRPDGPPDAGFFFRENGDLDRKQTPLVFPFDSAPLREKGPIETDAPAPAPGSAPGWWSGLAWKRYQPALLWAGAALLSFGIVAALMKTEPGRPGASLNPFDLRIARSGQSLLVDWNRNSPALRAAPSASLSIDDGGQTQTLTLDRAELEHGSVQFWPQSKHVVVRMDVMNSREISESVTAVVEGGETVIARATPGPAPPAAPVKPEAGAPAAASRSAFGMNADEPASTRAAEARPAEARTSESKAEQKPRPFHVIAKASSNPPRSEAYRPAPIAPASGSQPAMTASATPPSGKPPAGPAPQPPSQTVSAPPPATKRLEHVVAVAVKLEPKLPSEMHKVMSHIPVFGHMGGLRYHGGEQDFHAPQPERSLEPKVPGYMADNLRAPVDISVLVSVDKSGKVKSTEVTEGAGTGFGSLAADRAAAIAWAPGRIGEKPVASQVIAHFHFRRVEKEVAEAPQPDIR